MLSARPMALDGELYHAKTPARAARDKDMRQENLHRVPMTVNGKGKPLQTPRRPMTVQSHKALSHSSKPTIRVQLGDKTPYANRVANAVPFDVPVPQTAKLAKLALLEAPQEVVPDTLLRPSSARKSLRAPRLSGGVQQLDFKTPITRGDHWNVSDGEIDVDADEEAEAAVDVRGEDDDEIEYMPPTAIVPTYEPPFEMPDYAKLGAAIRGLAHSYKFDDADLNHAVDAQIDVESHDLWQASGFASPDSPSRWDTPALAPLENELLIYDKPTTSKNKATHPQVRPTPAIQHKHTSSLPVIRATSSTRSIPTTAKPPSGPTRPLSRAPSTTSTAPASRTASSSSVTSTKPPARPVVAPTRPRSQTTSQIARPTSAPSTKLETSARPRAGAGVPSKAAPTKTPVPVARAKTTTSVYATARATPGASKPVSTKPVTTRPAPGPSRPGTSTGIARTTSVPANGKAAQSRVGAAPRPAGVAAGKKSALQAPNEGDLLRFDDVLLGGDDFAFDV